MGLRRIAGGRAASSGDDDEGGQDCPGQREVAHPRSVQSVSKKMIERHVAGAGEREGGGAPPEDGRILKTALAVEEAFIDVHRGGYDHRAGHRSTGTWSAEPGSEERTAAGFAQTGRDRVQLARAESEPFERRAGPLETRAAEPAEQFLHTMSDQCAANGYPDGEKAEIANRHMLGIPQTIGVSCIIVGMVASQTPIRADQRLLPLLEHLARVGRRAFETTLEPGGLRPRHLIALKLLSERGPASQQALADSLSLDPSNVVGLLNELEERGLITRRRESADRRRHIVELSPRGKKELCSAYDRLRRIDDDLLSPLSARERATLYDLLVRAVGAKTPSCDIPEESAAQRPEAKRKR